MFDLETGRNEELDISSAQPMEQGCSEKCGKRKWINAAAAREKRKRANYSLLGGSCQDSLQLCLSIFADGVWKQRSYLITLLRN